MTAAASRENHYEMYRAYKDIINPLFTTVHNLNGTVRSAALCSDDELYPRNNILQPLQAVRQAEWFGAGHGELSAASGRFRRLDTEMLGCAMLQQPLTENAVAHGINHREAPGRGVIPGNRPSRVFQGRPRRADQAKEI